MYSVELAQADPQIQNWQVCCNRSNGQVLSNSEQQLTELSSPEKNLLKLIQWALSKLSVSSHSQLLTWLYLSPRIGKFAGPR
jgi:hypothetical protein